MRLAHALLAACAVSFTALSSPAEDAPPKADAAKPLRLALVKDKTYLYRLRETISVRQDVDGGPAGILPIQSRVEILWDAGVSLQRLEADGNVVVSLMPTRVRGEFSESPGRRELFDSDDPKTPVTSPLLGRGICVTLSPAGRVLDATGPAGKRMSAASASGDMRTRLIQFDPVIARPFAQQFFQELPGPPPRAGLTWDGTRSLAPHWLCVATTVVGHAYGDAVEKATVTKLAPEVVTATLRARGTKEVTRSAEPTDLVRVASDRPEDLGEQLEEWLVLGEVRIRRDSGLVESRTATSTIDTHEDAFRLRSDLLPQVPGLPKGDIVTPASDHTHEVALQLDLIDVR
jgi:hypothetical protein